MVAILIYYIGNNNGGFFEINILISGTDHRPLAGILLDSDIHIRLVTPTLKVKKLLFGQRKIKQESPPIDEAV